MACKGRIGTIEHKKGNYSENIGESGLFSPMTLSMEKRLFLTAVAIAVIGGIANSLSPDLSNIATLLVTGAGVWIGWTCASGESSKDFAMSAAFLVFLNAAEWGNVSAQLGAIPYGLGSYASGIFTALTGLVVVIAAVGLLKNLMDRARVSAGA
ncbi:MAG: hypothetical protein ACI84O_000846 [Myxococcota bacterium]|jgi:hypothetical protein